MKSKSYPTLRFVSERIETIRQSLCWLYYNTDLSKDKKRRVVSIIEELDSHKKTLLHYAPFVPIDETNFPRTVQDVYEKQPFPL